MSTNADDIMNLTHRLQQDLRDASTKLVQLRAILANSALPTAAKTTCPRCNLALPKTITLTDHLANVHHEYPGEAVA